MSRAAISAHECRIRPWVEFVESIERGPAHLGVAVLEQRAQRLAELLLRGVIGYKGPQRNGSCPADRCLGILHQGEKFWEQRAAEFGSQLAHHESHPNTDFGVRVGERGTSAAERFVIHAEDAHGDGQRLHERSTHSGRGLGISVAHFVREIAQRVASDGERLQRLLAHEIGFVEQGIGDENNVGFRRGRAERTESGDGGGSHDGVGIFRLLGDE